MIKPLLILGLLLKTCTVDLQDLPAIHRSDIDNFNNTYHFNTNQELEKQTIGNTNTQRFGLSNYGNDPIIDASFPLEIALFFYKNGTLVLLDNQMNILMEHNLYEINPMSVSHFGRSIEGMYWIFNQNTKTLQKISPDGKLITQSNVLPNIESRGIQRIYDLGREVYIQNGTELIGFTPNLKYIGTEKDAYMIRSYKFPAKIVNGTLSFSFAKKTYRRSFGIDSIPIGISQNNYVLQTQNGLILQKIK